MRLVPSFPTLGPQFELGLRHVGYVLDRAALGQVSSEYFGFPCHSFIPPIAPQSTLSIIQGRYNKPVAGCSNSGLGSTPAPQTPWPLDSERTIRTERPPHGDEI
jgi:hypothetical protein